MQLNALEARRDDTLEHILHIRRIRMQGREGNDAIRVLVARGHDKLVDVRHLRGRGGHGMGDHARDAGLVLFDDHLREAAIVVDGDVVELADALGGFRGDLVRVDVDVRVDLDHGISDLFLSL